MHLYVSIKRFVSLLLIVAGFSCLFSACGKKASSSTEQIITVAAKDASHPTIAVNDKTKIVYVTWVGSNGEEKNVYLASMRKNEDQFSSPIQVNDIAGDAAASAEAPAQIAVGPEGNIYILWHQDIPIPGRRFPASNLRFTRSTDGGNTFSPAVFVNDDFDKSPTAHNFHAMTVAQDGTVYVSWLDGRDKVNRPEVRVARSNDHGQSFEPGVVVADKVCTCCGTAITTDAGGIVYVVFRNLTSDNVRDIVIARSEDGAKTFSSPVSVHDDGWVIEGCPHNGPSIDTDEAGDVHVTWYTGQEDRIGLYYAVSKDGSKSFSHPRHINSDLELSALRAAMVSQNEDDSFIACEVTDAQGSHVYLLGPKLSTTNKINFKKLGSGNHPRIAKTSGFIVLTWLDGDAIRSMTKAL